MTLALHLLGIPRLELRGRVIKLGIKPMLVLAYLALEGRATRRDLARMLWSSATDPLNSVSAARISIRDVLKKWLEGDNETLTLQKGFYCDVAVFTLALESKEASDWQAALELHRGALLEGVRLPEWDEGFGADFEEWLLDWREKLEEQQAELSWRLARFWLQQLEFESALSLLENTQGQDLPPREDATRLLILTAGALKRQIRAQTAFSKLERRLQEELEVSPSAATRAALQLARTDPQSCLVAIQKEFQVKPAIPAEENAVPLFGRDHELQQIHSEMTKASGGLSRLVLLTGEPGVGKSRLTQEVVLAASSLWVLHGVATPTGVSLGLFDRLVRQALSERSFENINRLWQQALAAFLPDSLGSTQLEPSKEHLFAALTGLLTHPSRQTVLILDDLQWADKTSIEFILHLMRQPHPHGLLLLATLRDTETPRSDLKHLLELVTREHLGIKLELRGLSAQAVAHLSDSLGQSTDTTVLHKKSGGNPFYLLELLRTNLDSHQLHDLVKSRLTNLPETAQQLLEVAALLGDGSNLAMLRAVSGRSLEEVSQNLDDLAFSDVLHLLEDGTRFKHDLIREVVLANIRPARKQILHLRAARALKPKEAGIHALAAVNAWEEADIPKMLLAFLETGKQHSIRGDLAVALEWFLCADQNSRNATERLQALTERASALERYGRHDAALETLSKVAVLEGSVTDPVLRSGAWLAKANLLALKMHRLEEAQVLVNQAFTALEGLDYSAAQLARSDALNIQGTIYRLEKKYTEAAQTFEASLSIRQALEDDVKMATTTMNLAMVYTQVNDPRTEQTLQQSLEIYKKLGDDGGIVRNLNNLGMYYTRLEDYNKALSAFQNALELNRLLFDPWAEARAYQNIGTTHFYLSEHQLAQKNYQLAFEKASITRDSENQLVALLNLLEVGQVLGTDSTIWLEQIKPFASNESFVAYHTEINNYLSQQGVNS